MRKPLAWLYCATLFSLILLPYFLYFSRLNGAIPPPSDAHSRAQPPKHTLSCRDAATVLVEPSASDGVFQRQIEKAATLLKSPALRTTLNDLFGLRMMDDSSAAHDLFEQFAQNPLSAIGRLGQAYRDRTDDRDKVKRLQQQKEIRELASHLLWAAIDPSIAEEMRRKPRFRFEVNFDLNFVRRLMMGWVLGNDTPIAESSPKPFGLFESTPQMAEEELLLGIADRLGFSKSDRPTDEQLREALLKEWKSGRPLNYRLPAELADRFKSPLFDFVFLFFDSGSSTPNREAPDAINPNLGNDFSWRLESYLEKLHEYFYPSRPKN